VKRAFLYGDWKAFRGSWFDSFNKDRHTLPAAQLPISPWMQSYASCDIGYEHDAACHWARQNPETQQICIYKEFGGSHIEAFELGAEIARHSLEELKTQPRLVVFVSHDAYHERTGDITYVDLLRQGASKILGKNAVFVPDRVLDQMKERTKQDGKVWNEEVEARLLEVRDRGLIFRRAPRSRVVGFTYMRGLMRLIPLVDKTARPDWEVARRICFEDGPEAYYRYLRLFANPEEILPKLLIAKECVRLIDGIPKLVHDEDKVEEPSTRHFEGMDWLESCLVGGTLVATAKGEIPIDQIKCGDRVWTRKGLRKVLWAGMTQVEARTITVTTVGGASVTGTPSHPVWVVGKGFIRLDSLRYGDILLAWSRNFASMVTPIGVSPIPSIGSIGSISGRPLRPERSTESPVTTGICGSLPTGQSQKGLSCITRKARSSTAWTLPRPWRIWSASQTMTIGWRMGISAIRTTCGNLQRLVGNLRRLGTLVRRVWSGIGRMPGLPFATFPRSGRYAFSAVGNFGAITNPDFAITTARLGIVPEVELTTKLGSAFSAKKNLSSTATPEKWLARAVVVRSSSEPQGSPVYNLQVEDVEEFFANGILVHNCRYLLLGMRDTPLTPEPADFHRDRVIAAARLRDPNLTTSDLIWINRFLEDEAEEKKRGMGGFSLPRSSRALARSGRMLLP
jgi:hypothetical protein